MKPSFTSRRSPAVNEAVVHQQKTQHVSYTSFFLTEIEIRCIFMRKHDLCLRSRIVEHRYFLITSESPVSHFTFR